MAQEGSSCSRLASQSQPSEVPLGGGAGSQEEQVQLRSEYCKEQLMKGGEEFSFEELRAQMFQQRRQQQLEEQLRRMDTVKQQLSLELEEKKKLLQQRRTHPPQVQVPEVSGPDEEMLSQPEQEDQVTLSHLTHDSTPAPGNHGDDSSPGGAVDPCDPAVRHRLLDICDVTSCPDLHLEPRPLPAVEEHSLLQLGGDVFLLHDRVLLTGSFSVYRGSTETDNMLIKVDSCPVPWDFHQFGRLKQSWTDAPHLPLVSCFLFLDGCLTVYRTPPGHTFTLLQGAPQPVELRVLSLLRLVSQLHSCSLLHAGLQPHVLTSCSCLLMDLLPLDWSCSVDLNLQPEICSTQQLPAAQRYISLGLLAPDSPAQLVDLVGVAETVHLLLTNKKMVLVKDEGDWTVEEFRGDEPCDIFSRRWRRFFRTLLNVRGRSSLSVLKELQEELSTLYC